MEQLLHRSLSEAGSGVSNGALECEAGLDTLQVTSFQECFNDTFFIATGRTGCCYLNSRAVFVCSSDVGLCAQVLLPGRRHIYSRRVR